MAAGMSSVTMEIAASLGFVMPHTLGKTTRSRHERIGRPPGSRGSRLADACRLRTPYAAETTRGADPPCDLARQRTTTHRSRVRNGRDDGEMPVRRAEWTKPTRPERFPIDLIGVSQDARFSALGDILPQIITDLTLHTSDRTTPDRDHAEALTLRACHMARVTSNLLGHHDLGWAAVQRELVAAERVGAPELVAASAWDLCGVWLHEASLDGAKSAALAALDDIDEHLGTSDPALHALSGALHLRAAVAYSRLLNRQEAESHLDEAARVAERLPADGNVYQTQFNRVNTRIHAVEISLELGRPRDVASRAEQVEVAEIASGERQAHYWTCTAAGMVMNRKEDKAVDALLIADRIAPQHVRNRPLVRNLVRDLRSSGRHSKGPQVRALAARMGLD
jgi:hypothetical protein